MRYGNSPMFRPSAWTVSWLLIIALCALIQRPACAQTQSATDHAPTPVNLNDTPIGRSRTPIEVTSGTAKLVGRYAATSKLRLVLGLNRPKMNEEEKFLKELQDRTSANFHKYLTADQWNARFSPSAQDEQAVVNWATNNGLTVTKRYPNRLIVDVEGTSAAIEKAFAVKINTYQVGTRTEFSNDQDPAIPANLADILHSVGGLNSIQRVHAPHEGNIQDVSPAYVAGPVTSEAAVQGHDGNKALYDAIVKAAEAKHGAAQGDKSTIKGAASPSPGVTNGYIDPADIFSSYGYDYGALMRQGHCCNPLGNSGSTPPETTIAIATAGDFANSDIYGFQAQYPYLATHWNHRYIDGTAGCCNDESTLDVEWALATANSEGSYVDTAFVWGYVGVNNYLSTFTDVYNQMLTDGYARIFSTSWGCREFTCSDSGTMDTDHGIFNSMLGQGWTIAALSHDQGAVADCASADGVSYPGSDPDAVSVGGTSLALYGDGTFYSETAWEGGHGSGSCSSNGGGSGGGCSSKFAAPGYQSSPYCGTGSRSVPDVAVNAGYGQNYYFNGSLQGVGGTSISTPQVAGFMAQENAYLLAIGKGCGSGYASTCAPMGQPDWAMYRDGYNSAYASHFPFYDVNVGCNSNDITDLYGLGYYCAGTGYDAVTGWGSFNALQLSWAISSYYAGGYSSPTVTFSGPSVSTSSDTWFNTDQTVSWTVTANACCGYVPTGIAGFNQAWDSPVTDTFSEPNQGSDQGIGNAFYTGPQFPNASSGYLLLSWAGQGCHYATVDAWDNTGFTSGNQYYYWICYDTVTPTISVSNSPVANSHGWNKQSVAVTLSAADPGGSTASGISRTYYAIDTGACYPGALGACAIYSGPVTISAPGSHYIYYFTEDNAGNFSSEPYEWVSIDETAPVTKATLAGTINGSIYDSAVKFSLSATDSLSGVQASYYQLDGGAVTAYSAPVTVASLGSHKVSYYSVDNAGNKEVAKTAYFSISSLTTTTLTASPNPAVNGQSVTLKATVAASLSGTPTGTVTFKHGSTSLGTGTLSGGVATLTTSALPIGSDALTAAYAGASTFFASTSSAVTEVVFEKTTTTLTSSLNPAVFGQTVTFTAKVKPSVSGTPTGSVKFLDGTTLIGTVSLSGGSASFATHTLAGGTHSITADYSGDSTYKGSNSAALTETINKATSATALSASVNPSSFDQAVTFTAKVTSSGGTPAGTVTFKNGSTTIGTGTLSGGVASFATSALAVGTHSITAVYGGSVDFDASTSPAVSEVTKAATTTTTVVSSLNPSNFGQSVTFTATVKPATSGTPTGTVTFKNGTTTLGTATLSGGKASFAIGTLSVGTHSITAVYGGNTDYQASTSAALSQTVKLATTTTTLTSSLNPSTHGTAVTFTAKVVAHSGSTPTGTVTFKDGSNSIGTGTLNSTGVATLKTSTLAVGTHSMTAVYGGSSDDQASTSAAISQVVK